MKRIRGGPFHIVETLMTDMMIRWLYCNRKWMQEIMEMATAVDGSQLRTETKQNNNFLLILVRIMTKVVTSDWYKH